MKMSNILKINGLNKSYPGFELNNINMEINPGEIIGLVGENGAGKTTLIKLILNLIERDNGSIEIFGCDNKKHEKTIKNNIGFVFDSCHFHQSFTCHEIARITRNIYENWDNEKFNEYLSLFHVEPSKKISDLSKGMKVKLMLSIALSHSPDLLILDEITAGLDPVARYDVLEILKHYIDGNKRSILFSTHIVNDLDIIANKIVILKNGSIVFKGEKEDVYNNYIILEKNNNTSIIIDENDVINSYATKEKEFFYLKNSAKYSKYESYIRRPSFDDIVQICLKGEINK